MKNKMIIHVFLHYIFKGGFTKWLDGSPLVNVDWNYRELRNQWPQKISLYNADGLLRGAKLLKTIHFIIHLSNIFPQPEHNMERNCTAVFTPSDCKPSGWVAIPCEKKILTSFLCKNIHMKTKTFFNNDTRRSSLLTPSKRICDKGWFLVGHKCLYFIIFNTSVSFNTAKLQCASYKSKQLSIEQVVSPDQYYEYNFHFKLASIGVNLSGIDKSSEKYILTGIPFLLDTNYYIEVLIYIIFRITGRSVVLPIIESGTNNCWIVEQVPPMRADIYTSGGLVQQDYGMKQRLCSAHMNIFTFICEKPPIVLNETCEIHQFKCNDDSCILLIYVCDSFNDCYNKEDEVGCPLMEYNTDGIVTININTSLLIPCIKNNIDTNSTEDKTMVTYVHVHSLCDGRHLCNIVSEEQCTYEAMQYISLSHYGSLKTSYTMMNGSFNLNEIIMEEIKHYKLLRKGYLNNNETQVKQYEVSNFQVLCKIDNIAYNFTDYCYVRDRHLCTYGEYSSFCSELLCPGMFKCGKLFCIRLSSMCDGYTDCPESEDEINCANLSCQGFLKCRNENRCVGLQQICDGVVDCHYSYDDELYCGECPTYCICTGYTLFCTAIHVDTYTLMSASYAKTIIFRTSMKRVLIQNMLTKGIVYIDLSACEIQSISSWHSERNNPILNLLYANFSDNLIQNDAVQMNKTFSKLVILDISNNLFTTLGKMTLKYSINLKILKFDKNPVTYFQLSSFKYITKLTILSIKHVDFHKMVFVGRIHKHLNFAMVVHDISFCCYVQENVDCVVKNSMISYFDCNGLIHNKVQELIFNCLTAFTFLTVALFTGYNLYYFGRQAAHNYFFLISANIGLSDMLLSGYFICLSTANTVNVNVVNWQKSLSCIILHGFLTISLTANIILKVESSYVLLLKIIYPFKHQCRYVSMATWLICLLVWSILTVKYTLFFTFINKDFLYSVFCTVWCQNSDFIYFNVLTVLLELISICSLIVCVRVIAFRLNASAALYKTTVYSNRTLKVSLPFVLDIVGEIALRFPITIIVVMNILGISNLEHWCKSVVVYLLPSKIIFCSSFRILCKLFKK